MVWVGAGTLCSLCLRCGSPKVVLILFGVFPWYVLLLLELVELVGVLIVDGFTGPVFLFVVFILLRCGVFLRLCG